MSHILTLSDRTVIQTLLKVGYSQKQIAEEVGVAPSTINYELKRCPKGYYDADQAQEDCEKKLTHRGRKTLLTENLREFVRGIILEQRWSFEVIAHILQMPFKTLYNWLDKGWLDIKREVLPDHGVRYRKSHDGRGQYTGGAKFINQRPDEANLRQEIGHFEVDTILSGKTRGEVLATFTDRKSRLMIIRRLPGRDSKAMTKAILELNEELRGLIKSITSDHGKKFAGFKEIEAYGIAHYFAHPYAPHERGTNERLNRELRLYIPKNQPIESVTDEELTMISKYLNWRPRKCLGWKTPLQVFFGDLSEKFD